LKCPLNSLDETQCQGFLIPLPVAAAFR